MYYLNAFNEMLRKRQRQNMMGGEGVGSAPPSGPMGLGPAQDRSSLRDFYNNMSPGARFGLSMIPGVGTALNIGNLANYAMSQYDKSQLASSLDARERAQDQFRAFEIADMNAPMQNTAQQSFRGSELADSRSLNTPQQSFQTGERAGYGPPGPEYGPAPVGNVFQNAYEAGMVTNSFPAERMGGTVPDDSSERLSVVSRPDIVSDPMSRASLVGTSLAPMATDVIGLMTSLGSQGGRLQSGGLSSQTGLYGDAAAGMNGGAYGGGAGAPGANADSYGGGDAGFGGNSQAFNQGGMVTSDRLMGRAPAPDDGYGALQGGEYVITKAAVEKYGKRLLDAINNGTFR